MTGPEASRPALNAPYAKGTHVTALHSIDYCPDCGSSALVFHSVLDKESGLYDCASGRGCIGQVNRDYTDVTPVETAPQTPPPCPVEWCTADHEASGTAHIGARFGHWPTRALVVQRVGRDPLGDDIEVALMGERVLFLSGEDARGLADTIEQIHTGSPLAAALRQAAAELDRITGGA